MKEATTIPTYIQGKEFASLKKGAIPPSGPLERMWNSFTKALLVVSAILIALMVFPICIDIAARFFFDIPIEGIVELETLALVPVAFMATGFLTVSRQHIQVDLFFEMFSQKNQLRLAFLGNLVGVVAASVMAAQTFETAMEYVETSSYFYLPLQWFVLVTSLGYACAAIGFFLQICHSVKDIIGEQDALGVILPILTVAALAALPFLYKASGVKLSGITIGCLGFLILFSLLLLRVPIAFSMVFAGIIGLMCLKRTPAIALGLVGDIPFLHTADFVFVAIPMFMLMGELAYYSGLSADLFECTHRWLGRLPGGLAVATVGGCAGFGAVCGESLPTIITMSAVALPPMRDLKYSPALSTGALAAGGTLGILIPPSMGFIFYSIITEQSVGKLFIAGIIPGILLSSMFMLTIIIQVKRNPSLAPKGPKYTWSEKFISLLYLTPVFGLFVLVVGGILAGAFTPGEGGAVGAMGAFLYALARRRVNFAMIKKALMATVTLSGKIFIIFAGVYCFGAFLSASRLPNLLADLIVGLDMNRYAVLAVIVLLYISLGCVMNIIPMMLLTLPSIYPTVEALGFDGIWFGVVTVMLMEMGMITPPVGMNVFTMSSLAPDIPMTTIFKGVLPFFLAMVVTILLIIIFPGLATWLPNMLV